MDSDEFKAHITRVMGTLDTAVQNLDDLAALVPCLKRLGTIHASMGIKEEQLVVSIAGSPQECHLEKSRSSVSMSNNKNKTARNIYRTL